MGWLCVIFNDDIVNNSVCYAVFFYILDSIYFPVEKMKYKESIDARIFRISDNLQQLTLSSKGMGAGAVVA